MQKEEGFTLIELMIVIAVIAVLAAILIPNFIRARAQSQLAACESNERDVAQALEMYATDNSGSYPPPNGTSLPNPAANNWFAYVRVNPVCPVNRAGYIYTTASTKDAFTLSQGPAATTPHAVVGIPANFPQYWSDRGLIP